RRVSPGSQGEALSAAYRRVGEVRGIHLRRLLQPPRMNRGQTMGVAAGSPVSTSTSDSIWVLVLTSTANLMVGLDAMVVSTALAEIGRELGASIEMLEWTVNAYALSFAAFLLTAAVLGDRFGRRRLFLAGIVLFVAASAACALASSIGWLIAARAIQ